MMRKRIKPAILFLLFFLSTGLYAQRVDSVAYYLDILKDLAREEEFRKARLEAKGFRQFMSEKALEYPPESIPLLSGIFRVTRDRRSAYAFLQEVEVDARYCRDLKRKEALLESLVMAFGEWGDKSRALPNQKALTAVKDSLAKLRYIKLLDKHQIELDSVRKEADLESEREPAFIAFDKKQVLAGSLGLGMLVVFLLLANIRTARGWRKRFRKKDIELELLRANLKPEETIPPFTALSEEPAYPSSTTESAQTKGAPPEKTALLIVPNRQIILYLKTLLTDQFKVETALSGNEGIDLANKILPDLIICDGQLEGQNGIELIRQLKLGSKTNHVPIILLSEHHGKDGALDALRAGAESWFPRPVLDTEIENSLNEIEAERKEAHRAFQRYLNLYHSEQRPELNNRFLNDTIRIIEQCLSNPDFMADELARKMQFDKVLFSRKLKMLTGKTPGQLIREMRLEKAKVLLENKAAQPQTVSEIVGYSNPGSFAHAFQDYFGENNLLLKES